MRIGITYLNAIFKYGYPHGVKEALNSIADVQQLGFRFLEMEGLGAKLLSELYEMRHELARIADDCGVHVHNFCVVDPDLVSMDSSVQAKALDGFRKGAEIAAMLGSETLHLASYAPPVEYLGAKPYQLGTAEGYSFADACRVRIPGGFQWSQVWAALVRSCRECADIASEYRRTVIMEPRIGEMICSVDSLLRLIEHVDRPNFKANFDTGHFCAQRENVVLALTKLCGVFANIHLSDNNPVNTDHLPIGEGTIDWPEFFRVLKQMEYDGYLGLDFGRRETLVSDYRASVERIQEIGAELGICVEV